MKLLCSCAFIISFFSASLLMAQSRSTYLSQAKDFKDSSDFIESDDSIYEEELDLVLERWERDITTSKENSESADLLAKLERERLLLLEQDEKRTADLSNLQVAHDLLLSKQQALVEEIKDLAQEYEEEELSDDSIDSIEDETFTQKVQFYESELSLVEQEIWRSEGVQHIALQELEELREKRFELEVEIQDIQMLYGTTEALSEIEE